MASNLKTDVLTLLSERSLRKERPVDAYKAARLLSVEVPQAGQALEELEAEGRAISDDPSGTVNDWARCFRFHQAWPREWDLSQDRAPFRFEGKWWCVKAGGLPRVLGPFATSREAATVWADIHAA